MKLSIIIPVFNEELVLPMLFDELFTSLKSLPFSYEVIFVDDGSRDNSKKLLWQEASQRAEMVVVTLETNFGQHQAIIAGFSVAKGEYVVTLDADLQTPPSEIIKICNEMDKGHDYVGSIRNERKDSLWRRWFSQMNNRIRQKITNINITDQGCMLRGYHKRIAQLIVRSQEAAPYLPALGYNFSRNPAEVVVEHQERQAGDSKYNLYKLFRLNFDIMTAYSLIPLQLFSMLGMTVAVASAAFFILLVIRRLFHGPEAEGVFTLFALVFFFMGVCLFGLGLLGEYVGRIYAEVRKRPRYSIQDVYSISRPNSKEPCILKAPPLATLSIAVGIILR